MINAVITFTPTPGVEYVISYKKASDAVWIIPVNNPTTSSPFIINNMESNVLYDFRLQSECGIETFQGIVTCDGISNLVPLNID